MKNSFTVLTVSQLNRYVKSLLDGDRNLAGVFLRGEISNFTNHYRSGHFYMTLKDENAAVKAVMFRGSASRLAFMPQDGMRVIAMGRASVFDRDGQYQFYIEDMQPDGVGALHIAFEQLREKLQAEGLFDEARKRPLPAFPARVGVVTSATGAAVHDIQQILARRWPLACVVLAPVAVQGDGAPEQICAAIGQMNAQNAADVLIVGRGGGSIEDLWAFNDERVARAIAASSIPVVSAVGHETDFTIADFAADRRAPTPSAAAELVSPDAAVVQETVFYLRNSLRSCVQEKTAVLRRRLEDAIAARAVKTPLAMIDLQRMRLDFLSSRAQSAIKRIAAERRGGFSQLVVVLDSLSPLKIMARGYAIPMDENGAVIQSAGALQKEDRIRLRMTDGLVNCRVTETEGLAHGNGVEE